MRTHYDSLRRALLILLVSGSLTQCGNALAVFDLTVSPRRGGQSLRFAADAVTQSASQGADTLKNEEVTLTVDTDQGLPYQIFQTMHEPFRNESGQTLPQGSFIVFSPSSPSGTLRTQLESPVTLGQTSIYSSNSAGDAVEFLLVYNVHIPEDQPGGVYRSRLNLTLEPLNGQPGLTPRTTTLDVLVELQPKFSIRVTGAKGGRSLDLGTIQETRRVGEGTLRVEIQSSASGPYRLWMSVTDGLMSQKGFSLDSSMIRLSAEGGKVGQLNLSSAPAVFDTAPVLFYRSAEFGGSDQIDLQFQVAPSETQAAGSYRGALQIRVESESAFIPQEVITVPMEVEIGTIFSLETIAEGMGMAFGVLKGGDARQDRQVTLKVLSNTAEPYQVSQIVSRKMSNSQGTLLPDESFRVRLAKHELGTSLISDLQPVREGETPLYTSDKTGTPDNLVLEYSLEIPIDAKAGAYSSEIKYTITTL